MTEAFSAGMCQVCIRAVHLQHPVQGAEWQSSFGKPAEHPADDCREGYGVCAESDILAEWA